MNKPKLVRIDPDVLEAIIKLAKENDRSIPRQINRILRKSIVLLDRFVIDPRKDKK